MTDPHISERKGLLRWYYLGALLLFLGALLLAAQSYFERDISRRWQSLKPEVSDVQREDISARITQFTQGLESFSSTLLRDSLHALLTTSSSARRTRILEHIRKTYENSGYFFELRDAAGELAAFSGRPIGILAPHETDGFSVVERTPYTMLVHMRSIHGPGGQLLGTLAASTPLTVSIPVNNRFLHIVGFKERLERELDVEGQFVSGGLRRTASDVIAIPLTVDGHVLGSFMFPAPDLTSYLHRVTGAFQRVFAVLLLALLGTLSVPAWRWYSSLPSVVARRLLYSMHILSLRAIVYAAGIFPALFPQSLFSPEQYASTFGWGISSSPGELTISTCTLMLLAVVLYRDMLRQREGAASVKWAILSLSAVFLSLPVALRAFAATIRSIVRDSSTNFDSVSGLIDFNVQGLLLFNMYLLSLTFSLILICAYLLIKRALPQLPNTVLRNVLPAALALLGLVLLTSTTATLLLPLWAYALVVALFLSPLYLRLPLLRNRSESLLVPLLLTWVGGALLSMSLTMTFMDEKRSSEVEAIAVDVSRPVDGWSQVLMEQTLQYLQRAAPKELAAYRSGTPPQGPASDYRTAFRLWAGSPLSRLQNNSAILLLDMSYTPISRFAVGSDPFLLSMGALLGTVEKTEGIVQSAYRRLDTREKRYYKGYSEIMVGGTKYLAAVVLEALDAMQMSQRAVDLLRSTPAVRSLAPEDQIIISRFHDAAMVQTSDRRIPRATTLPHGIRERVMSSEGAFWASLPVGTETLDTYFILLNDETGDVLAISKGRSVFLLLVYRWLRTGFHFFLFSLVFLLLSIPLRSTNRAVTLTFARKLQLAFLLIAAIPLLLIWVTGREFVADNIRRDIEQQVGESLDILRSNLLEQLPDTTDLSSLPAMIHDDLCQEIRLRTGKDINVYQRSDLNATSRPELYYVGLLNRRIHPEAFLHVVMLGKDLHFTEERIGEFSYYVGYQAIRDHKGTLAAVISTPTLFERDRGEEVFVRASASILLWITVIALLVILVSSMLARQISRPLAELLHATQDITRGNLERKVRISGPAEFGTLMGAFNTMTDRLRKSQEELAAAERELAWREMAKQVAHEIRNPLTPMKLAAQHLQRAYRDGVQNLGELIEKLTSTMIDQIDSLSRISDEFSRFARMPRRSTGRIDVGAVLEESLQLFRQHEHIKFTTSIARELPEVIADREELARAFMNILRNAVQAIQADGAISVTAAVAEHGLRISVRDNGSGIEPDVLQRIFEPNFSTRTEGMGLGLAIVHKIITDAGGSIDIESTPGHGSSVHILLPAA